VDAVLGLLLHTSLDVPGLAGLVPGLLEPTRVVASLALWTCGGALCWLLAKVIGSMKLGLTPDRVRITPADDVFAK
jgi:hypothetical protein